MASRYATHEELEALYPQFANTLDTIVDLVMSLAEMCIGLSFYSDKASEMHLLMSAHMLWLHPAAGPTGLGPKQQMGTATVGEAGDGLYSVTIGTDLFAHTASSDTATEIAVALAALIDAHDDYTSPVPTTAMFAYTIDLPGVARTVTGSSPNDLLTTAIVQVAGSWGSSTSYSPGAVASMSDGPSSVSWHAPASSSEQDAWLTLSPPGQTFAALNATFAHKSAAALARRSPGSLPHGHGRRHGHGHGHGC